ncbi:helix-turn-helix domain-containing protein [Paenibacillus aquistagni]|uniref:DNA-binding transcriptional regulator, XRE-family HTH domain n=1 Tax=Paenibacillus aquistagni TaxID=1852522 RepID=A0A1X7I7X0_9BACL|nr:helix-turn-helix transcriptional regulator [Paenibacillus aquistagni]NMM51640.1 helix-turn-helix transcriptional regulator [Paenibacillus aquistagni]SMG10713.1 DNA-binding transcriptional regulator, XRE-family HTH domain [Paenibacillus aquistagni]
MQIGDRLRTLRREKNLTTTQLSKLSGVTQSTISEIENDNRSPQLDTLDKICQALGISINELFPAATNRTLFLSDEEKHILQVFYQLNPHEREALKTLVTSLLDRSKT